MSSYFRYLLPALKLNFGIVTTYLAEITFFMNSATIYSIEEHYFIQNHRKYQTNFIIIKVVSLDRDSEYIN